VVGDVPADALGGAVAEPEVVLDGVADGAAVGLARVVAARRI
jgi:hypothetical protein